MTLSSLSERNPITTRWTDVDHLRSLEFHAQVLQRREESLTFSAGRRIRKRIDAGLDPFFAFAEVQSHVNALAQAYVERITQDAFHRAVQSQRAGPLRDVLERLAMLYGLSLLEKDRAWFLENGFFDASKSRAIVEQVDALCGELADDALALTDAFDIPETSLAAPIARR